MNEKSLLQIVLQKYNLTIEDVLELSEEMTRKEIINNHVRDFSPIWQGKNGRWYTYLPDDTKKSKRRQIAKSTEEKLNIEIIAYYKKLDDAYSSKRITLQSFYPEWLNYKALHTEASSYMRRINNDWDKYYADTPIIKIPLVQLDKVTLDTWAHELIRRYSLTKTQYYNITVIIRQSLDLAVDKGIIEKNPFSDIKINSKLFRIIKKKADATQVFLMEEQTQIENEAIHDFIESDYSACLGIALCFQLGARLGEMVALKWSDINEEKSNYLHIQRMERKIHTQQADGTWKCTGYEVVEHTKSSARDRNTYISSKAKKLLEDIRIWNEQNGFKNDEYIFLGKDGKRIHSRALDTRIRKYCRHLGINEKSMHKIRKTYISTLIDSNLVNINTIREMVGHEDERTTFRSYCYNRNSDLQTQANLEHALCV